MPLLHSVFDPQGDGLQESSETVGSKSQKYKMIDMKYFIKLDKIGKIYISRGNGLG